ncbi:MAG: cold shock domain-containing protein, partial [Bryobacteraceae bacterium]|nr:cold shock domain-containing protein [Bryobacteraceae bacterium]
GYGFIHIHDDLPNVYCHNSVLIGDLKALPVGAKVTFKICDAPGGRVQACRVELHERGLEWFEKYAAQASC